MPTSTEQWLDIAQKFEELEFSTWSNWRKMLYFAKSNKQWKWLLQLQIYFCIVLVGYCFVNVIVLVNVSCWL